MRTSHCALIVEDQARVAKDLAEILGSIDCDSVIAANKQDALALLDREQPCVILLDLNIPRTSGDIKGRTTVGISLLQAVRERFGNRREKKVWIPIIVVSGHAREVDQVVEIMKLDADDLIQKPYDEDVVVRKVREALRKSGRETHGGCAAAARTATSGQVVEIPGTMVKNRSVVTVSGKAVQLSDASLTALLRLLVAHVRGESVPLSAFGRDEQNGYKVVDRLRSALRGAVANPTAFVINCAGRYSLAPDVALGTVNTAWLTRRGNATITDLARELNPDQG